MSPLRILYDEIDERCREIEVSASPWPCRRGCDACCRRLHEPPRLVREEWQQLEEGLAELPPDVRSEIEERLETAASQVAGPVVCPFLDLASGACRVYAHRPAACRTYGYYRSHDAAMGCELITAHAEAVDPEGGSPWDQRIVWGSQDAVDRRLSRDFGAAVPLKEWLGER